MNTWLHEACEVKPDTSGARIIRIAAGGNIYCETPWTAGALSSSTATISASAILKL